MMLSVNTKSPKKDLSDNATDVTVSQKTKYEFDNDLLAFITTVEEQYKHLHDPELHTSLITRITNNTAPKENTTPKQKLTQLYYEIVTNCNNACNATVQHLKITKCFWRTLQLTKLKHDFAVKLLDCHDADQEYEKLRNKYREYARNKTLDKHPGFVMLMTLMNKKNTQ